MKNEFISKSLVEVGKRLEQLRKRHGFASSDAFADRYDIPPGQYRKMESGSGGVTLVSLLRVLAVYEMSLEDFFCQDSPKVAA